MYRDSILIVFIFSFTLCSIPYMLMPAVTIKWHLSVRRPNFYDYLRLSFCLILWVETKSRNIFFFYLLVEISMELFHFLRKYGWLVCERKWNGISLFRFEYFEYFMMWSLNKSRALTSDSIKDTTQSVSTWVWLDKQKHQIEMSQFKMRKIQQIPILCGY